MTVVGKAYLPDGDIGSRFTDTVNVALADRKEVEEFASKPYHYKTQMEVTPGIFQLKVVFSSGAEKFGSVEAPFTVDPWAPDQFLLSGLAFSTKALPQSSGDTAADLFTDNAPLVVNGVRLIPSGANHFRRSDKVFLYGEIYEPAPGAAEISEHTIFLDAATRVIVKEF